MRDADFVDLVPQVWRLRSPELLFEIMLRSTVRTAALLAAQTPHALDAIRDELRQHVAREIGPVAKPDDIRFAETLPKTRSGKIMRRLLKQIASGTEIKGDTTTLEDFSVLAKLAQGEE